MPQWEPGKTAAEFNACVQAEFKVRGDLNLSMTAEEPSVSMATNGGATFATAVRGTGSGKNGALNKIEIETLGIGNDFAAVDTFKKDGTVKSTSNLAGDLAAEHQQSRDIVNRCLVKPPGM